MAPMLCAVLVLVSFTSLVSSCSVVPGGCELENCVRLRAKPAQNNPGMGFYFGLWATNGEDKNLANKRGGAFVNYEVFTEVGTLLKTGTSTNLVKCCQECARTTGCIQYQFFNIRKPSSGKKAVPGFKTNVQCYLLKGGRDKKDDKEYGTPYSGTHSEQLKNLRTLDPSWVGGNCNGTVRVVDDPHFVGAKGTRFDFNGELDKSFCLTTDERLHVNIVLRGYVDSSSVFGATPLADNKALRSWIKEVALMWTADDGSKHTVLMIARNGKQQDRGDGFMSVLTVDGNDLAAPSTVGDAVTSEGGFSIRYEGAEKKGPFDVDHFIVTIDGLAVISIRMRVAHPLLQSADDAEAHFNLEFQKLQTTPAVHGVLGQTYRQSEEQQKRALEYGALVDLLHHPVAVDSALGKGFLDGETADYVTSDVLSADCKFAAYV